MTKRYGSRQALLLVLAVVTLLVLAASIRYGAIDFSVTQITSSLGSLLPGHPEPTLDQRIFLELRLPRAVLCLLVGASLGVGGTLMQALVRNPIVEPGLVGTSTGAAFGSAVFFVLGAMFHISASLWSLPIAACAGGIISTYSDAKEVVTVGVVHDLNLAVHFGDQLVLLNEGRVVAHGKAKDVLTSERIHDVFGVKPTFIRTEDSRTHIVFN